jgi:predicted transcriptional regulator
MDLEKMRDYIEAVGSNPGMGYDGTAEAINEELAEQGQQIWYDDETGVFFIGPMAQEED